MKAAARAWASGRGGARMKADDAMTQGATLPTWMESRLSDDVIELAPDEAAAFGLFIALGTQWHRHALTGIRTGIDYGVIPATAAMMEMAMTPALLADIQAMEGAALAEFHRSDRR